MSPIVLIIDYLLGIVMWTLIGRSAMRIFLHENSTFFFNRAFIKMTDPFVKMFRFITPQFIVAPLVPIYVAWFFYMIRFYFMPWILGYSVMGMLSFPLESSLAGWLYSIF